LISVAFRGSERVPDFPQHASNRRGRYPFLDMQVHILAFGILKESLGPSAALELPDGASVTDLLNHLRSNLPASRNVPDFRSIAVGVNAEYVSASHVLRDGDEVALLPPVSGGTAAPAGALDESTGAPTHISITREVIDADCLVTAAKRPEDGAVVVFDGIVRNHSRGRETLYLEYEAYEEMALRQMKELAEQARSRFAIRHVTVVHRLGRLEIGESSVLIIVASAHRGAAYDASRWIIDTLKQTVPIWKKEIFADGAVWAPGEPFPASVALNPEESNPNG
jgi:MoaE-MoaD fusion protein